MIGISTSWGKDKEFFALIKEGGFSFVELSHGIKEIELPEIKKQCENAGAPILGIHAPAPLPYGSTSIIPARLIDFVHPKEEVQKLSFRYLENSVKNARSLRGEYVVVHLGGIPSILDIKILFGKLGEFKIKGPKPRKWTEIFLPWLSKIIELSESNNVKIGIENRYFPSEFPNLKEFQEIFDNSRSNHIGFWYDAGHAYVREYLGIEKPYESAELLGNYLLGFHIHNARKIFDHRAPLKGDINFSDFFKRIKKPLRKFIVFESHRKKAKKEEILTAKRKIEKILGIPEIIPRFRWGAKPHKGTLKRFSPERIIIHHTAIPEQKEHKGYSTIQKIQESHLQRFQDIGYHFLISPDGKIYEGRPLLVEGAHTKRENYNSLGIALIGNFEKEEPTDSAMKSLISLIKYIKSTFSIKEISCHRDFNPKTECPGKFLKERLKFL